MTKKPSQEIRGLLKLLILNELENNEITGYEVIQRISEKITKKPSPGSVYPILKELTDSGILNCKEVGSKKLYTLSEKGKELLGKIYETEKEAIFNKVRILRLAGVISKEEAEYINTFISEKRQRWFKLYKLKNWLKFIDLFSEIAESDPELAESIISECLNKLEKIRGDDK